MTSSSVTTTLTETSSLTLTSTKTVASVTSTQTVGSVATAYASQFELRVLRTQAGVQRYVKIINANEVNWLVAIDDFSTATIFSLSPSGILFSLEGGAYKLAYSPTPNTGSIGLALRIDSSIPSDRRE